MPSRLAAALGRRVTLVTDLLRGGDRRHAARARLGALKHRLLWRARRPLVRRRPTVLVGMVEHFGDIVAAEPVARHVKRETPDAYLVWAVKDSYRELIDHNPHIDAALPVGCIAEWLHLKDRLPFDRVIDLHVPGRLCPVCNVAVKDGGANHGIDITNYYSHGNLLGIFCRCAGLPVLDDPPHVYIPKEVAGKVDGLRLPERFVAVHCTSNQDVRDWSAPKWNELARRLTAEAGVSVVEVGLKPVIEGPLEGYVNRCGRLSLLETAEVIRRAKVFVGIDSGPAHLANAVGTHGVILLGHYRSYKHYLPYSGDYASGANASGANASGANASGANASGANASGANASGANASGANASGANASGANASGANAHVIHHDGPAAGIAVGRVFDLVCSRLNNSVISSA